MAENWRVGDAGGSPVEEFFEVELKAESGEGDAKCSAVEGPVRLETKLDDWQGSGE